MIDQRIVFALVSQDQPEMQYIPIPCMASYDPAEPFQVNMQFKTPARGVDWVFGRDILIDGLIGPAGDGDVRVWTEDNRFYMKLTGQEGSVKVFCSEDEMESFVKSIVVSVPIGGEAYNFDQELKYLMEN